MAKFREGDIVRSKKNIGRDYKIVTVMADGLVETETLDSDKFVHTCRADILELVRAAPAAPFTLLDDEGRKALKAGDRVLVEVLVVGAANEDGEIPYSGTHALDTWATFAAPEDFFALLPPAEKPIAVGDFVNILGRTGSQGKVLAFMSNGHAVVEYVAGDDFNVSHYNPSCLKVI